ncbi:hypothetical protein ACQ1Q5_06480 [Ornithobacterium rhinotracheale]
MNQLLKAFNFFGAMAFALIPVIAYREWVDYPNQQHPLLQWLWIIIAYGVIAPIIIRFAAKHTGRLGTQWEGTYKGRSFFIGYIVTMIIWAAIFFWNK